jgi:hypothetical protein
LSGITRTSVKGQQQGREINQINNHFFSLAGKNIMHRVRVAVVSLVINKSPSLAFGGIKWKWLVSVERL